MKNSNYYKNLTSHQQQIVDKILEGSVLKSSEGKNYKSWLVNLDNSITKIKRNTAEAITNEASYQYLSFTNEGIKIKVK